MPTILKFFIGALVAVALVCVALFLCFVFQYGKESVAAAFAQAAAVPAALVAVLLQYQELQYQREELEELTDANRKQADELKRGADLQQQLAEAQAKLVEAQKAAVDVQAAMEEMQRRAFAIELLRAQRSEVLETRNAVFDFIESCKLRAAHKPQLHDPMRAQIKQMDSTIGFIDQMIADTVTSPRVTNESNPDLRKEINEGMNMARLARQGLSNAV